MAKQFGAGNLVIERLTVGAGLAVPNKAMTVIGDIAARGVSVAKYVSNIEQHGTTTLSNSTYLQLPLQANTSYLIDLYAVVTCYQATSGAQANLNYSGTLGSYAGSNIVWNIAGFPGIDTSKNLRGSIKFSPTVSDVFMTPAVATDIVFQAKAALTTSTAGTLAFAFAQYASYVTACQLQTLGGITATQVS
jgi:hypothetical protein